MKKNIVNYLTIALLAGIFASCSDWTETEAEDLSITHKTETYYQSLREYKKTPHSITFGWFGGWQGTGAATQATLAGIPDSMDIVSLWSGWSNPTKAQLRDLRFVQEKKGTRVVFCSFTQNVGQNLTPPEISEQGQEAVDAFWGWVKDDEAAIEAAIRKYARAFVDTVYKYGYDGFDMDHEPNFGGSGDLASHKERVHIFLSEFRTQFDKRGGNKLLIVDGEPQSLKPESGPLVDWMVVQAYSTGNGDKMSDNIGSNSMDSRLAKGINNFAGVLTEEEVTNRYVLTENFESAAMALLGGYPYTDRYGDTSFKSLEGMARWQPTNGFRKGGTGTYHMEYEAGTTPSYRWMRQAIQIMNPALL